jgi:hypothetical protein
MVRAPRRAGMTKGARHLHEAGDGRCCKGHQPQGHPRRLRYAAGPATAATPRLLGSGGVVLPGGWFALLLPRLRPVTVDHDTRRSRGNAVAAPTAPKPQPRTLTRWQGQAFLWVAQLLQRALAHRRSRVDVALRNAAMRAAHARGVDREVIVRAIGLSQQQVGEVLRGNPSTE